MEEEWWMPPRRRQQQYQLLQQQEKNSNNDEPVTKMIYNEYRGSERRLRNYSDSYGNDNSTKINAIAATAMKNNKNTKNQEDRVEENLDSQANCDESKCVSGGAEDIFRSFTCYFGQQDFLSGLICADGYQPRIVGDEPLYVVDYNNHSNDSSTNVVSYQYFTCCPPTSSDLSSTLSSGTAAAAAAATTTTATAKIKRHCSDPIPLDNDDGDDVDEEKMIMVCDDENRPYPRKMKKHEFVLNDRGSYICCDSFIDYDDPNTKTNYLNEIDCVPYKQNVTYTPGFIPKNTYGNIFANMVCYNNPEFPYPKPNLETVLAFPDDHYGYDCCRSSSMDSKQIVFVNDAAFKQTIFPQITVSLLGLLCSITLVLALTIPLLLNGDGNNGGIVGTINSNNDKIRRRNSAEAAANGGGVRWFSSIRSSFVGRNNNNNNNTANETENVFNNQRRSIDRTMRITRTSTQLRRRESAVTTAGYSSFNAYLIYLALPDILLNGYLLGMYTSYALQKLNLSFNGYIIHYGANYHDDISSSGIRPAHVFEGAFTLACSLSNLYLNAVISNEILTLLQKSKAMVRYRPPTKKRVMLQSVVVYAVSTLGFILNYFFTKAYIKHDIIRQNLEEFNNISLDDDHYFDENEYQHEKDVTVILFWVNLFVVTLAVLSPVGFTVYVAVIIRKNELMKTDTTNKRMRELVWYFFRIILVFILAWIPGLFCVVHGVYGHGGNEYYKTGVPTIGIGFLFVAIQPVFSLIVTLMKSDVRKYVLDLLTLSYCRRCCGCYNEDYCRSNNNNNNERIMIQQQHQQQPQQQQQRSNNHQEASSEWIASQSMTMHYHPLPQSDQSTTRKPFHNKLQSIKETSTAIVSPSLSSRV